MKKNENKFCISWLGGCGNVAEWRGVAGFPKQPKPNSFVK